MFASQAMRTFYRFQRGRDFGVDGRKKGGKKIKRVGPMGGAVLWRAFTSEPGGVARSAKYTLGRQAVAITCRNTRIAARGGDDRDDEKRLDYRPGYGYSSGG